MSYLKYIIHNKSILKSKNVDNSIWWIIENYSYITINKFVNKSMQVDKKVENNDKSNYSNLFYYSTIIL